VSRPLRIEFAGALHDVMARGNARAAIVLEDVDRQLWVDALGRIADRFDWQVWAYCLMDNHYPLLVETPQANLSRGMLELNGVYTQAFNRRYARVENKQGVRSCIDIPLFRPGYKAKIAVQRKLPFCVSASMLVLVRPGPDSWYKT